MSAPYASATSGSAARAETVKFLRRMGCESVGFMDDFAKHEVLLAFTHRGRPVQIRASAKGWATLFLKIEPHTPRHRKSRLQYEADALDQGLIAVDSIIRDWTKAQVTMVECGILSFDAVFMPHMVCADGRTVVERAVEINLLPPPRELS